MDMKGEREKKTEGERDNTNKKGKWKRERQDMKEERKCKWKSNK